MVQDNGRCSSIHLVSGGAGASGELLLYTLLAQFPNNIAPVRMWPQVQTPAQIDEIVAQAAADNTLIVHTFVDSDLRRYLIARAQAHHVSDVDLVGDLMEQLAGHLGTSPLGQPGRYRTLRNGYFKRIEAMEFAVKHDDGQRLFELDQADIVLIGISRVGKTPLAIYLSLEGWKVANVPIVPYIDPPLELERVAPARIVGLTVAPAQLVRYRESRQRYLGVSGGDYVNLEHVIAEVRAANHLFSKLGIVVIDATDKPIESSSEEVVAAVTARLARGERVH
jgi:[pyruvate, water dikinase]-phosphate phosphotransferase / [pyruvate, water dikinase] kinase